MYHADRVSIRVSRVAFINFNGESGFPFPTFFVDNLVGARLPSWYGTTREYATVGLLLLNPLELSGQTFAGRPKGMVRY